MWMAKSVDSRLVCNSRALKLFMCSEMMFSMISLRSTQVFKRPTPAFEDRIWHGGIYYMVHVLFAMQGLTTLRGLSPL